MPGWTVAAAEAERPATLHVRAESMRGHGSWDARQILTTTPAMMPLERPFSRVSPVSSSTTVYRLTALPEAGTGWAAAKRRARASAKAAGVFGGLARMASSGGESGRGVGGRGLLVSRVGGVLVYEEGRGAAPSLSCRVAGWGGVCGRVGSRALCTEASDRDECSG
jgi:hypothetical protein